MHKHDLDTIMFTQKDVDEILSVSVDTVERLVARGELKACKVGRQVRVQATAVEDYIRRSEVGKTTGETSA